VAARLLQGRLGAGLLAESEVKQGSPGEQLGALGEEAQGLVKLGQRLRVLLPLRQDVRQLR
jgi:hypothetical protein